MGTSTTTAQPPPDRTAAPARPLTLAGTWPPRVAFIRDTRDCGDAPERGVGWIFANVEGERGHIGLLPGQSAIVVAVDSLDGLALLEYILKWPGPDAARGARL